LEEGFVKPIFVIVVLLVCSATVFSQAHQHGPAAASDGQFNPFIVSDNRGGFYLAYIERAGTASNVMLRHSTDGKVFSTPVRVNDRDGDATVRNENPPKIAVAPNGDVYVCWANERGRWKGNIRFARSTDGGKSFSSAITLNSDGQAEPAGHAFQSIAVDTKGRIYIVWIDERNKQKEDRGAEIWMTTSENRGKSFSLDRRILADVCECCRTNLQVDAAGKLYLSYRTVPRTGPMYRDSTIAHSEDGGKTFAATIASEDKWEVGGCPVAGPSFSFDTKGNLTAVWFMGGGERPGLYYAASSNNGASFAPRQLLDPQQKIGKHTHTIGLPDGKVMAAWDEAADKTYGAWGILDPQKGLLRRSDLQEGIAYPVVAANGKTAVIAAMDLDEHKIAIFTESLKPDAVTGSSER